MEIVKLQSKLYTLEHIKFMRNEDFKSVCDQCFEVNKEVIKHQEGLDDEDCLNLMDLNIECIYGYYLFLKPIKSFREHLSQIV